mgnify:CR=1 FL=1
MTTLLATWEEPGKVAIEAAWSKFTETHHLIDALESGLTAAELDPTLLAIVRLSLAVTLSAVLLAALPLSFDGLVVEAIRTFWRSRSTGIINEKQGAGRNAVVSGKNMDGFIAIVPYTDPKILQLFDLMEASDFLQQERFSTPLGRFLNMTEIYAEIGRRTPARTTADWMELFAKAGMPAMPVNDLEDVVNDPHFVATGFFRKREHPDCGAFREMAPPVRYSADPDRVLGFAPKLNEHGDEIRRELGL